MRQQTYVVEHAVGSEHWWFHGRRRILETLLATLHLPADALILDVGTGTGANVSVLERYGRVVGLDASRLALQLQDRGGSAQGLVTRMPFQSGVFDFVTALDLLEHLDDDIAGAVEIRRVTHARGRALFFVPAFQFLWGLQDEVSEHRRRYSAARLAQVLHVAGFRVDRLSYFNTLLFPLVVAGRLAMRVHRPDVASENELTPAGLNGILGGVFAAEATLLARWNLPVGVSLMAVATPR